MSNPFYAIYIRSQTPPTIYAQQKKYLEELDSKIFEHDPEKRNLIDKLFNEDTDDDNMIIFLIKDKKYIGYTYNKLFKVTYQNKVHMMSQLATGILSEHTGKLNSTIINLITLYSILKNFRPPNFCVGYTINPGLYRAMVRGFKKVYPSPKYNDKNCLEAALLSICWKRWKLSAPKDTEKENYLLTQDLTVKKALQKKFQPKTPEDFFFIKHNPNYKEGIYLGICCAITWRNIIFSIVHESIRHGRKFFIKVTT